MDDDAAATEQFVVEDDRVFGSVAAEDAAVYAQPLPRWFLAKIEPQGSTEVPIAFPAPGPEADATVPPRWSRWRSTSRSTAAALTQPTGSRLPSRTSTHEASDITSHAIRNVIALAASGTRASAVTNARYAAVPCGVSPAYPTA